MSVDCVIIVDGGYYSFQFYELRIIRTFISLCCFAALFCENLLKRLIFINTVIYTLDCC